MPFPGFPKGCVEFLQKLKKNNRKAWFEKHKEDYENYVLNPARDFVVAMGERLPAISPDIHADPRVNKSLFKIYRDVRFSKDKTPFKTNLGIWFWESEGPRFGHSGFYFHVEPTEFMLAAGVYMFDKALLYKYRQAVVHKIHGPAMVRAIAKVKSAGPYEIGGEHYSQVPRGFDPDHKLTEYLKYNALYAMRSSALPKSLFTPRIVDITFKAFKDMAPLHRWLVDMINR